MTSTPTSSNTPLTYRDAGVDIDAGNELVERIKSSPQYAATPVMIVSYKDREEDRLRGLRAGANYYLTKSSFHDETLVQAVADLVGEARG